MAKDEKVEVTLQIILLDFEQSLLFGEVRYTSQKISWKVKVDDSASRGTLGVMRTSSRTADLA